MAESRLGLSVASDPYLPPHAGYLIGMPYEQWARERKPEDRDVQKWLAECCVRLDLDA